MKKIYASVLSVLLFVSAHSQCTFNPTVIPSNLILCPNESDTLFTQVYDGYQWYKDGNPLPGDTNQYLLVNSNDAGSNFSVNATDSNCTEMSPQVLVDSWVFLPPFVMSEGDLGWFDGQFEHLCTGDTLILILMQPYDINIQWFNGASPIPGATDDTLLVTTDGSYSVEGAPSLCPNFVSQLGVTIDVLVHQPVAPVITLVNDTLFANPTATSYQWYLNATSISGATNQWYFPTLPGTYAVSVVDSNQCPALSAPFIITGVEQIRSSDKIRITYNGSLISVRAGDCNTNELFIYDALGRLKEKFSGRESYEINAEPYEEGIYLLMLNCDKKFFSQKIILQK